jgi:DNA repair protein RecN (Recombination protein N)
MLSHITIRNLVIVRHLDLAFGSGMSTLTGETGAGKSILIDALGLALGNKADAGLIRNGADKAEITAMFELDGHSAAAGWLQDHDFDADGECLLRRVIVRKGRSRAYINGSPVNQALLGELGELLVDIHGQHAHQSLLRTAAQRQLVDGFGGLEKQVAGVAEGFRRWRDARDRRDRLQAANADRSNRLDYLNFQIEELADLPLDPAAIGDINAEHARLSHAGRLLADSSRVVEQLDAGEPSVQQLLGRAADTIRELGDFDEALKEVAELLDSATIQVDEAGTALRHYQDRIELDPQRLDEIDQQLARLHDAARKHRCKPEQLAALLQNLQDEAASLHSAEATLEGLDREVESLEAAFGDAARSLSAARIDSARRLSETVTASMQTLGMQGGSFRIVCVSDQKPAAHGTDGIAFEVSANPGQPPAALAKIASGGELSRISLAIQVATADCGAVPTLIFDEVDVGIGGATAEIVGQLLRQLGSERQVLCVTHLPQVASQGHRQLRVHKLSDGRTTETRIDLLDHAARVDEIARMLGGVDITEQTRRHAEEMIVRAQKAS